MDNSQYGALVSIVLLVIATVIIMYRDASLRKNLKSGDQVVFDAGYYRVRGIVLHVEGNSITVAAEDGKVYVTNRKSIQLF